MKYLFRNFNDTYYIRLRIGTNLKRYFQQKEISKSLRTQNITQAKALLKLILHEYRRLRLLTSLGLYDEDYIQAQVDGFIEKYALTKYRTIYSTKTAKLLTHGSCLDEFEKYYKSLDIGDNKRNITLSYLRKVYLPIVGPNTLIDVIDFNKMYSIKETLQKLPKRLTHSYKSLTPKKLLKVDVDEDERISDTTLKAYIGYTKRFYNYCLSQQYIRINPCNAITVKNSGNAINERDPFTKEEVKALLEASSGYNPSLRAIYYTLAYTGLRSAELWKASISYDEDEAIWYLDLTSKQLKLKTKSSHRIVPLHSTLVALDIPYTLPQALREYKQERAQKVFNITLKPQVTSSSKKVLYSFRHSFATGLKYAKVDPLIISELMGHSHRGMTLGRYASRYPLATLKEAIDRLDYS